MPFTTMFKLKRFHLLFALLLLMFSTAFRKSVASVYDGRPKLVVVVVIDQFRGDYLERYRSDFKGRGFRLFLDHGANFTDCYYEYANTKTAPGHATLGTGAYTDGHGISSNEWWDLGRSTERPVSSVEDERYRLVGLPDSSIPSNAPGAPPHALNYVIGSSPRNLRASTIGDELRLATEGKSKVFGISLKDRAAILPVGASANGAFWIDPASGYFVTSTFYASQLPDWAVAFNTSGRPQQAIQEANTQSTTSFYELVGRSPAANAYELDFARALIKGENLGKRGVTDLITISLSANDIMGHQMGPDSPDEQAMVDHLDIDLDSFFTWLDKNVDGGLANVWVALSADHGVAPIPSEAANLGLNAATISLEKLTAFLNSAMNAKFSPGENIQYLLSPQELPYITLNRPAFERAGINEQEAEQAVMNAVEPGIASQTAPVVDDEHPAPKPGEQPTPSEKRLPPTPSIIRTYTRLQLAAGELPPTELGRLLAHSYSPNGDWYVMVIPASYQTEVLNNIQTTHFSPWSYDRHVPLAFYGGPFNPGVYRGRVAPVDLAATLASLLGVNQPSASVGRILTEALRPVPNVVQQKPRTGRAARTRTPTQESKPQ
jgi:Type I phosphodiesterase / nucleotide pyrophosphatase